MPSEGRWYCLQNHIDDAVCITSFNEVLKVKEKYVRCLETDIYGL